MDSLDLTRDDPARWEGKRLLANGCEYVVGAHLGTGAKRIVHLLTNCRSGLTLHVLKIAHRPMPIRSSEIRRQLAGGSAHFAKLIPVSLEIEIPGGEVEIQVYVGDGSPPPPAAGDASARQAASLYRSGHIPEAIAAYREALAENPDHTFALINLAAALADCGDLNGACEAALRAKEVEPNFLLYHQAAITHLGAAGQVRLALTHFRSAKATFPNTDDLCELGARLLLVLGQPRQALAEAAAAVLEEPAKRELLATVSRAVEASAAADAIAREAKNLIQIDDARALSLLERAHATHPENPYIAMNLAFALARADRRSEAVPLLISAAMRVEGHAKSCYFNAALCEADQARAAFLLSVVMRIIDAERGGKEPSDLRDALPGAGVWASQGQIIEKALGDLVAGQVANIASAAPPSASSDAHRLAALYAKLSSGATPHPRGTVPPTSRSR